MLIKNTPEAHQAFGVINAPPQNIFKKENPTGNLIRDIDGLLGSHSLPIFLNTKLSKANDVNVSIFGKVMDNINSDAKGLEPAKLIKKIPEAWRKQFI